MKKNIQKFETFCPFFDGFYGTFFEYDREEQDIEDYNEENGTNLSYDDFNWDYREYMNRVSKAFVNKLEVELRSYLDHIKIDFQTLESPREYNFYNDTINVSVELDLKELIAKVSENKEKAAEYIKGKFTSCDGFISFHSNDLEDWLNEDYILEKPEARVGSLLECLCFIELEKDDTIYWADDQMYIDFWPKEENIKEGTC